MRRCRLLLVFLLFPGLAAAQEAASTVIVPAVGTMTGPGVLWRTDVEIVNDTGSRVDVAMELVTAADQPVIIFELGPGEVQRFHDVVSEAFGLPFVLSPLRVISSSRRALTVRATVYGLHSGKLTEPQPVTAYQGQTWFPLRALDDLSFSDEYRTNIGLVNFGDKDAEFLLALQRIPGRNLAVSYLTVGPRSLSHMSIQSIFPLISKGDDFTVVIEAVSRDTYVFGSVIDNAHAGRFVAPRVATR